MTGETASWKPGTSETVTVNFDSTRNTLHLLDCPYTLKHAVYPKWRTFATEDEARREVAGDLIRCKVCF